MYTPGRLFSLARLPCVELHDELLMEGKLLKVCEIVWRCWAVLIVLGDQIPSFASLPQLSSPINYTTLPYSFWLQQSSLTTSPGLQQSPLTSSPGLQQTSLTTSLGLQQSALTTSPGLQQSPLTTSPGLQQSPLTTSPGLQQSPLTTSPGLQQSPLTTSPGLQQSPLTTSPGLQQSPLTTSPGPARSPRQHPPLVSTRDVPLTGNTPMGETQSSGQNTLQPIVSHIYHNTTLLRRKKRMDCFNEGVHVSNNLKEVMKTDQQSGTLSFYPEDDFEFVRIILTVTHGEQDGVFNKGDLCVKETRRWYTLAFSTYEAFPGANKWGIMVKVDNCINHSPTSYLYYLNWFHHMRVEAKGSSYWSTRVPGPDCLNPLHDYTTAGGESGAPVATLPSAADDTTAGAESSTPLSTLPTTNKNTAEGKRDQIIISAVVLTIVFCVTFVIVAIVLYRRRGGRSSSAQPPASPAAESPESPIYENVIRFSDHSSASHTGPEGSLENPVYENINLVELRGGLASPHDSVYDADCQPTAAPGERGSAHVSENSLYGAVC
ncbi:uncharacterized protein [Procambarus clarkii]|uniref:uncharacterized protein isoform X2 n=1 Tax=Procambarus clarkii TaxID=6728 RepID=UPI001E67530F|nr:uncharacterized protein LOC123762520 isoform X2 [Procambarus clarkii]XP_045604989.1 uncharacterized protein LOC123762520 isoform X2 [Procambarus clarkii]